MIEARCLQNQRLGVLALLLTLVAALVPAIQADERPLCDRVVAMGDIHGGFDRMVDTMQAAELIDGQLQWVGGEACFVQVGDMLDRGPRSREVITLLMRLQKAQPDRVVVLLGNHEVMNLVGDLRYVYPGEFGAYADLEQPEVREQAFRSFLLQQADPEGSATELRAAFDDRYPVGWFGHRLAFAPDGVFGRWLLERPVVQTIDGTLFLHGGLSETDCGRDLPELNRVALAELNQLLAAQRTLITAELLNPLTPYLSSFDELAASLDRRSLAGQELTPVVAKAASDYLRLGSEAILVRGDGPVWNREWASEPEPSLWERMTRLRKVGIDRVAVGHTPSKDGRIHNRLGDALYLIDTGIGPAYKHGAASALEILDGEIWTYNEAGRSPRIYERTDAEAERFLLEGTVVEVVDLGQGITKPQKVTLELDGQRGFAVFKSVHEEKRGFTKFPGGRTVLNFSDSYHYERPAYLLDRYLGLHRVPVAVERTIGGKAGVLIEWIRGTVSSEEEYEHRIEPIDREDYERQQDLRRVFDALIANTDRHLGNMLIRTQDWKLFLIDHTRSFRLETDLTKSFTKRSFDLPADLMERLRALDLEDLKQMTGKAFDKHRRRAILKRRDAILAHLEVPVTKR